MLDEAIEELTSLMIKEDFKTKDTETETMIITSKKDLIRFCIKLVKMIQHVEEL